MLYLHIEDLIANAMIELEKTSKVRSVPLSLAFLYGDEVIKYLGKQGYYAKVKMGKNSLDLFEMKYTNYFDIYQDDKDRWYLLNHEKTIQDVTCEFREHLPLEVIRAFTNLDVIQVFQPSFLCNQYPKLYETCLQQLGTGDMKDFDEERVEQEIKKKLVRIKNH